MKSDVQQARKTLENEVLPLANNKIAQEHDIEYRIVDETDPMVTKYLNFNESKMVYIAPVHTKTGEIVEEPSLLKDFMGKSGDAGDFQEHILSAFKKYGDGSLRRKKMFNIVAGTTYAKVKLNPLLPGNI